MQAYNQAINDLDKELDHLKSEFEVILFVALFFICETSKSSFENNILLWEFVFCLTLLFVI